MTRKLRGLQLQLLVIVSISPAWGQPPADVKQFVDDAVRSWKSFDSTFRTSICGTITTRRKTEPLAKGPFEIPAVQTVELRAQGECVVVIFPDIHCPTNLTAIGQNSKYGFRLDRQDSEKPWEVKSVHRPGADSEDPEIFGPVSGLCGVEKRSPLAVANLLLSDIFSRDDTEIGCIQQTPDGLVEVKYSLAWPRTFDDKPQRIALVSGSIKVDPANAYRPIYVSYTLATKVPTYLIEGSTSFFYESADAHCLLPTRSMSEIVQCGASLGIHESTYEWSFAGRELPQQHFSLTHFGLPEPRRFVEIE